MSESSWKYLKGFLRRQDFKQTIPEALQNRLGPWKEWAGQKISSSSKGGQERLALFPGWAARRYVRGSQQQVEAFSIDIFVSGFATVHRAPEMATRSQKAFLRLAKGFAALPKLEGDPDPPAPLVSSQISRSTEQLLSTVNLPPRPTDIPEDYELQALERHLRQLRTDSQDSSDASDSDVDSESPTTGPTPNPIPNPAVAMTATLPSNLRKLHANLEARLLPFWSSVLPNRQIRIDVFASVSEAPSGDPVCTQEVRTGTDGSFELRLRLSWEQLCHHPDALHIAFGDPTTEHEFLVVAEIIPLPTPQSSASSSLLDVRGNPSRPQTPRPARHAPAQPVSSRISLTHSPLRVISDLDDTVKYSNVPGGARAVFHNVFVKELSDLVIPGVGDWYSNMWKKGTRFHYVSNGPFEILPILGEFFQIAKLPPGSLKLKSYAGRSLFTGLLSAPAARKRAGVVDILDSFPDSRFILIGDSGEQDLELYAELARERSNQIVGVFIRHVDEEPLDDPLGSALRSAPPGPSPSDRILISPQPRRSLTDPATPRLSMPFVRSPGPLSPSARPKSEYFAPSHFTSEPEEINFDVESGVPPSLSRPGSATPIKSGSTSSTSRVRLSEQEKRRQNLQARVYRARMMIPPDIPLRLFKTPDECTEINDILENIFQ